VFEQVVIQASDREASERFYATVLGALSDELTERDEDSAEWSDFRVTQADSPAEATRGLHIGFIAASRDEVDAFWRAAPTSRSPPAPACGSSPTSRASSASPTATARSRSSRARRPRTST